MYAFICVLKTLFKIVITPQGLLGDFDLIVMQKFLASSLIIAHINLEAVSLTNKMMEGELK